MAARAAQLFEMDSSRSEQEVQTELSASLPSRAYISALYKQVFGPVLPNINMLTQWTYGIADSALCSASLGVPLESHFNYPALYQQAYRSSKVTEEQLDEFSQKLLGETSPFLSQLAERGPVEAAPRKDEVLRARRSVRRRNLRRGRGRPWCRGPTGQR